MIDSDTCYFYQTLTQPYRLSISFDLKEIEILARVNDGKVKVVTSAYTPLSWKILQDFDSTRIHRCGQLYYEFLQNEGIYFESPPSSWEPILTRAAAEKTTIQFSSIMTWNELTGLDQYIQPGLISINSINIQNIEKNISDNNSPDKIQPKESVKPYHGGIRGLFHRIFCILKSWWHNLFD